MREVSSVSRDGGACSRSATGSARTRATCARSRRETAARTASRCRYAGLHSVRGAACTSDDAERSSGRHRKTIGFCCAAGSAACAGGSTVATVAGAAENRVGGAVTEVAVSGTEKTIAVGVDSGGRRGRNRDRRVVRVTCERDRSACVGGGTVGSITEVLEHDRVLCDRARSSWSGRSCASRSGWTRRASVGSGALRSCWPSTYGSCGPGRSGVCGGARCACRSAGSRGSCSTCWACDSARCTCRSEPSRPGWSA